MPWRPGIEAVQDVRPTTPRQWILLRGLTREAAHWGAYVASLQQALPGDHVLALDLPGNGQFHVVPSPLSVQGMVQACRYELQLRAIAPPYHLLAMSLGAMVATEWAHQAAEEVAGCVLINTSMRPFNPFYRRLRPHNLAALVQLMWRWHMPEVAERIIQRMTSNGAHDRSALVAHWVEIRNQRPVSPRNALRQLMAAARYRAPAVPPKPPALLLSSLNDGLVASQCSQTIAQAWGSRLRMHPTAGHDLPLDDPQWVVHEICKWLDRSA